MYWFSGCFALFLLPQIPFCFLSSHIDNYWFALLPVASQEMKEVRKSVKFTSPTRAECVSSLWEKAMFSLLRGDFPQPLVFSKRVNSSCRQAQTQLANTLCCVPCQNPYLRQQRRQASHPADAWLQKACVIKLKWHSSSAMALPLQRGVLGFRQAVWMCCHRHWGTSEKKVKSETEKAVIISGLVHLVSWRWLTLHFRLW